MLECENDERQGAGVGGGNEEVSVGRVGCK